MALTVDHSGNHDLHESLRFLIHQLRPATLSSDMKISASVNIDRDIDDVFRQTTDHVAQWSRVVVEDYVVEETETGVGTKFVTVTEERGQRMEFEGTVIESDPPWRNRVQLVGKQFDLDVTYEFERLPKSTRVTQTSLIRPKGLMKVFFFLFGWMMNKSSCKAAEEELLLLKEFCEWQEP